MCALCGGCGKKTEDKPVHEPSAASSKAPPAAEPAKQSGAPVKIDPAKPVGAPSASDQELVSSADTTRTELQWKSPSGESITVAAKKRLNGNTWMVDLLIDGRVIETIDTGAEKESADGFKQYDPLAGVAGIAEGVLFISGSSKLTGKPDDKYDSRVLAWDAGKKQLVVARSIVFEVAYDPLLDDEADETGVTPSGGKGKAASRAAVKSTK